MTTELTISGQNELAPRIVEAEILPETWPRDDERPGGLTEHERLRVFPEVFAAWLTAGRRGKAKSASTQRAYLAAWEDFSRFVRKPPWRVLSSDVRDWVRGLRERPLTASVERGLAASGRREGGTAGLSDATIAQWLAAISSFYEYGRRYMIALPDGNEVAFLEGANPVKAASVPRPQVDPYDRGGVDLSLVQVSALLDAISVEKQRNVLQGLRDYALFLSYVATAARNSEIRCLRWGDIAVRGGIVYYGWINKGKRGESELPPEPWAAILEYLERSGRAGRMAPEDYLFTPLTDNIIRLRRELAETWHTNRPLSAREVNRLLRKYARRAGLPAETLHVHTLRHTAAMLQVEIGGATVEEISDLLHHSNLAVTTIYLRHRRGQRNAHWAPVASALGL